MNKNYRENEREYGCLISYSIFALVFMKKI